MKVTGLCRRIDDLGKLQIPKDIRKQLKLSYGDLIEFYIDGENIVLKKYREEESEE